VKTRSSRGRVACVVALLATQILVTGQAAAQPQCSTSDPVYSTARKSFLEGNALRAQAAEKGDDPKLLRDARNAFLTAYRACALKTLAYNLAQTEIKLHEYTDGMRHLRAFLRLNGGPMKVDEDTTQTIVDDYQKAFEEANAATAHVTLEAAPDSQIVIDGKAWEDRAPLPDPIDLMPGEHTFEARRGEQHSKLEHVAIAAGQELRLALPLEGSAAAATTAGVTAQATGAETNTPDAKPFVVGGLVLVGAIGITSGFFFADSASADSKEGDPLRARTPNQNSCVGSATQGCARLRDLNESIGTKSTLGVVSFVGGGLALGAAVAVAALWHTPPRQRTQTQARATVTPAIGPGHVGLHVAGHF
jgi:hypothetical protein